MLANDRPPFFHLDRLLVDFAKLDKPSAADFARVGTLGVMYDRLDQYRMEGMAMSSKQLREEGHQSSRLARHMAQAGDPRPSACGKTDCHAIISGGKREAIEIRAVMAWLNVRIDDPHNGCWLPKDWGDRVHMPYHLRNGVPHSRIHHDRYYTWLAGKINVRTIRNSEQLIHALRMVRSMLQAGAVPPNVYPKTGQKVGCKCFTP